MRRTSGWRAAQRTTHLRRRADRRGDALGHEEDVVADQAAQGTVSMAPSSSGSEYSTTDCSPAMPSRVHEARSCCAAASVTGQGHKGSKATLCTSRMGSQQLSSPWCQLCGCRPCFIRCNMQPHSNPNSRRLLHAFSHVPRLMRGTMSLCWPDISLQHALALGPSTCTCRRTVWIRRGPRSQPG